LLIDFLLTINVESLVVLLSTATQNKDNNYKMSYTMRIIARYLLISVSILLFSVCGGERVTDTR